MFVLVALLLSVISAPRTYAKFGQPQVWGQRPGSYFGAQAYVTTPDPPISSGWSTGPTGVTDLTSRFIEAGPTKEADGHRHPYASWIDEYGRYGEKIREDIYLAANGYYQYLVTYAGSGVWDAYIRTGSGWYFIATPRLYRYSAYPYVASGGESSSFSNAIGPLTTSANKYRRGSSWYSWCYTEVQNNCGGTISPCSSYSWSVSYSP